MASPLAEALRDFGVGLGEVAGTIGTGWLAQVPAGWAGLVELARSGLDPELRGQATARAANRVRAVQDALTYIPRSDVGQRGLENIGKVVEPVATALRENIADPVGDYSPLAGAALLAATEVAGPRKGKVKVPKRVPKKVAVGSVFDAVTDAGTARSMALRGKHLKRVPGTGKYVGAPDWVDSPGALAKLRRDALRAVESGEFNADWYTRQRQLALDLSDDPVKQSLFARGTAAYSPQAMPKVELPAFLRQHNEAMLSGKMAVPRTGAQARNVAHAYATPGELHPQSIRLGRKTGPYALAKDPTVPEGVLYKTANDIWHGRVMGYGDDFSRGFTPQEHGFLTGENLVLAERAAQQGMPVTSPRDAQAATWGATRLEQFKGQDAARFAKQSKARARYDADPERWRKQHPGKSPPPKPKPLRTDEQLRAAASEGLDTAAPRQTAYITQEAIPGRSTEHLAGLIDADDALKQQYTADILRATGRDPTVEGLGLYSRRPAAGLRGQYTNLAGETEFNPAWSDPVMVSNVRDAGGIRTPDVEKGALDLSAKIGAYMRGQEAGAWNRFIDQDMSPRVSDMNAARLRNATPDELKRLRGVGLDVVQVEPDVHHITRFGDAGPTPGTHKEVVNLVPRAERGTLQSGYETGITGNVGTGEATRGLVEAIEQSGLPPERLSGRWQEIAPVYNEIDRALSEATGFKLRQDLMRARDIVSRGGLPALMEYVRKHGAQGLPAVVLGVLGLQQVLPSQQEESPAPEL